MARSRALHGQQCTAGLLLLALLSCLGKPINNCCIFYIAVVAAEQCMSVNLGALKLYEDFNTSATSATGPLPAPGTNCNTWSIMLDGNYSACREPDGQLLLELWLTDANGSAWAQSEPGLVAAGVMMLAARRTTASSSPPTYSVDARGRVTFEPALASALWVGDGNLLDGTLVDPAVEDGATAQRLVLPVGQLVDTYSIWPQTWDVVLAPTTTASAAQIVGWKYALRATCSAALELPCARASPGAGACGADFVAGGGSNGPGSRGSCVVPPASSSNASTGLALGGACECSAGFGGRACANAVLNTSGTSSGVWQNVPMKPQTWTYFSVSVPAAQAARLMVEMRKSPGGHVTTHRPVLVLGNRSSLAAGVGTPLPGLSDIKSDQLLLDQQCGCSECVCSVPYQAESLDYEVRTTPDGADPSSPAPLSYWVGVFNAANDASSSGIVEVRTRWTTSATPGAAPTLCPLDCSGRGTCQAWLPVAGVDASATAAAVAPLYECVCNAGFGGPYCQGTGYVVDITNDGGYFGPSVQMSPGEWHFYTINVDPEAVNSMDDSLVLRFASLQANQNLLLAFATEFSNSVGNFYFRPGPGDTWVLNRSMALSVPLGVMRVRAGSTAYNVGILNSEIPVLAGAVYQLRVYMPTSPSSGYSIFTNKLQIGIIATVAGLIVVLMVFLGFRVMMIRRSMAHQNALRAAGMLDAADGSGLGGARPVQQGVPPDITDTFPVFKYSPTTFTQHQESAAAQLRSSQAAHQAAAAAAAAAAPAAAQQAAPAPGGAHGTLLLAVQGALQGVFQAAVQGARQGGGGGGAPQGAPGQGGTGGGNRLPAEYRSSGNSVGGDGGGGGGTAPVIATRAVAACGDDDVAPGSPSAGDHSDHDPDHSDHEAHDKDSAEGDIPQCSVCICVYEERGLRRLRGR
ncbi:hypothetical protein FOA52_007714 [Chlamydomonas sp. UWO 241]|nr:hypothetical protein FOA52_007714 [Chlamydomonas sp. UWO 241]